jgi:hypothetical protein
LKGASGLRAAAAGAIVLAIFAGVSTHRLIDGDEGFYLVAARLVGEGKRLYRDFFYLQLPALPHVFAAWFAVAGAGWVQARLLAAILAAGIGILYATFYSMHARWALVPLAVAFVGMLVDGSAVKTYESWPAAWSRTAGRSSSADSARHRRDSTSPSPVRASRSEELGPSRSFARAALGPPRASCSTRAAAFSTTATRSSSTWPGSALRYPEAARAFGDLGRRADAALGARSGSRPCGSSSLPARGDAAPRPERRGFLVRYVWIALGLTSLLPNRRSTSTSLLVPFLAIGVVEDVVAIG